MYTKQQLVEAYRATADKYLHPLHKRFFDMNTCAVCQVCVKERNIIGVGSLCRICPSNINNEVIGCIEFKNHEDLYDEILPIGIRCCFSDTPTPLMIDRANQLLAAADFIEQELTDQELEDYDFTRVYPLLS